MSRAKWELVGASEVLEENPHVPRLAAPVRQPLLPGDTTPACEGVRVAINAN